MMLRKNENKAGYLRAAILSVCFFVLAFFALSAEPDAIKESGSCKTRLPHIINNFERTLVPVITIDGRYLYMDRKNHPDNTGSINDPDDIWVSRKITRSDFEKFPAPGLPFRDSDIDFLKSGNDRHIYFGASIIDNKKLGRQQISDSLFNEITKKGVWTEPENIGKPLNTPFSDVLFSISPDGNKALVYGIYDRESGLKKPGFSISKKIKGKWSFPEALNIKNYYNSIHYGEGYKARYFFANLSGDGKVLMLALNRMDGMGGLDLYVSFNEGGNNWSEPKNLGPVVNSPLNEASPFLAYDNRTLYFASNGLGGYGMLDLYVSRRLDDTWTNWSPPVNLGPKINTEFDEKSIYLTALGDTAYIVSKDTVSKMSGIYYVCLPDSLRPGPYAVVTGNIYAVTDNNTAGRIFDKLDFTIDRNTPGEYKCSSDIENFNYHFVISADTVHTVLIEKKNYDPYYSTINTRGISGPVYIDRDVILKPEKSEEKRLITILFGTDIDSLSDSAKTVINDYFNANRDAAGRFYKVIGHADEEGSSLYNLDLSMRRALNAADYLKTLGVDSTKIKIEWKGEIQPISKDYQANRRVEVYVE